MALDPQVIAQIQAINDAYQAELEAFAQWVPAPLLESYTDASSELGTGLNLATVPGAPGKSEYVDQIVAVLNENGYNSAEDLVQSVSGSHNDLYPNLGIGNAIYTDKTTGFEPSGGSSRDVKIVDTNQPIGSYVFSETGEDAGIFSNPAFEIMAAVIAPFTAGLSVPILKAAQAAEGDTLTTSDYIQALASYGINSGEVEALLDSAGLSPSSGTWSPPPSIAEQMGLPEGTIINFSDITPEMISGISNPEIAAQLAELGTTTGSGWTGLLDIYNTYQTATEGQAGDFTGPGGLLDQTVLDYPGTLQQDEGGSPPGDGTPAPVAGTPADRISSNIESNPSALEEYWAKNPDELERAIAANPSAFGLLGTLPATQEEISGLNDEHPWVYSGNDVFINSITGESVTQNGDGYTVGEHYSNPGAEEGDVRSDKMYYINTDGVYGYWDRPDNYYYDWDKELYVEGSDPNTYNEPDLGGLTLGGGPTGGTDGTGTGPSTGPGSGPGDPPLGGFDINLLLQQLTNNNGGGTPAAPYDIQRYDTTGYDTPDYGQAGTSQYTPTTAGLIQPMVTPASNSGQPSYAEWGEGYGLLDDEQRRKENLGLL